MAIKSERLSPVHVRIYDEEFPKFVISVRHYPTSGWLVSVDSAELGNHQTAEAAVAAACQYLDENRNALDGALEDLLG